MNPGALWIILKGQYCSLKTAYHLPGQRGTINMFCILLIHVVMGRCFRQHLLFFHIVNLIPHL